MTADLTREQAREQVAQAIYVHDQHPLDPAFAEADWLAVVDDDDRDWYREQADAALSVLWPEVERLTRELSEARQIAVDEAVARLKAEFELAHAHAVIARHVEPRREGEP